MRDIPKKKGSIPQKKIRISLEIENYFIPLHTLTN